MKKNVKRLFSLLLVFCMIFSLSAIPVSAAKTKNVKYCKSYNYSTIKKKATTVKKGTTILKYKSGKGGYVKFKAPRAGKYKFTLSNVMPTDRSVDTNGYAGFIRVKKYRYSGTPYLDTIKIKTEGGKSTNMQLASPEFVSSFYRNSKPQKASTAYRNSRSAKIKMKKGETIFIYAYFTHDTSLKLTIKK